jgi:hypothetical protein
MAVPTANPTNRVIAGPTDDVQFHHLVLQQPEAPFRPAFGRRGQSECDQSRLGRSVKDALPGGRRRMLMLQGTFEASFDQPLPGSGNRVDAGVQRGGDLTIAPSFAVVRGIRLQQDACPQQLSRGVLALVDRRSQLLSFLVAELHNVFLDGDLFPGHESAPLLGREHRVRDRPQNQGRESLASRLEFTGPMAPTDRIRSLTWCLLC